MKKKIQTIEDLKDKLLNIQKIIGEPIDVNIGVEIIKGKENIKILNIATNTGLKTLINPLTRLIMPLQQLAENIPKEKEEKHRIEYVG
jgi:hypothetical protein